MNCMSKLIYIFEGVRSDGVQPVAQQTPHFEDEWLAIRNTPPRPKKFFIFTQGGGNGVTVFHLFPKNVKKRADV